MRIKGLCCTNSLSTSSAVNVTIPLDPMLNRETTALVVEDREVELAEALGVGEHVDFDDPPARDREAECDTRPSARRPHQPRRAIHKRRLCGLGAPREGLGHCGRAADLRRCAHLHGCAVGPEYDVRVEQREKTKCWSQHDIFLKFEAARKSKSRIQDLLV